MKRIVKYMNKHPHYNAGVHWLGGIGLGFLLAYPVAREHPVRWGVAFLALSLLGYLKAAID